MEEDNEEWCLDDQHVALPAFGKAPSHPVMYNPQLLNSTVVSEVTDALVQMSNDVVGSGILENVLNTPGIVATNAEDHMSSYSSLVSNIPGISAYYSDKYTINETVSPSVDKIRLAYEVKADYENIDENPQLLADYLEEALQGRC